MQSCAFMNGQHQQAGPLPQPAQAAPNLTHSVMRNQLSGTANNACLGVQPPQSACFASRNGIYSQGQTSYWQPSAGPHQAVSPEQKSKKKINSPLIEMLLTSPSTDGLSKNHCWPTLHGLQPAAQHNLQQTSATQGQPNKMTANATYNHTKASSQWQQKALVNEGHSVMVQDGQMASHFQQSNVRNGYYLNASGDLTNPGSAYSTTPTSLAREHISVSATAHNRQTAQAAHNQIHRQNNPQLGFSPSAPQAGHMMSPCQPRGNNSIPTHSSSRTQMLYAAQGSSACNKGGNYTISSNANQLNQYETRLYLSKTNEPPLNHVEHQQMLRHNVSADSSHLSYTACHNHHPSYASHMSYPTGHNCPPSYASHMSYTTGQNHPLPYIRGHNAKMTKTKMTKQSVPSAVSKSCNLNNTQSLSLHSGQSLPESSQSFMSRSGHLVNEPPQQNSVPNVVSVAAAGDGSLGNRTCVAFLQNNNTASEGNPVGSLSGASQLTQPPKDISPQENKIQSSVVNNPALLEMTPSVKQNDGSTHSLPGQCSTRAVAVVQPLSLENSQSASTLSNTATNESSWNPDKVFVSPEVAKNRSRENLTKGSNLYPDNPNQLQSNKSDTSCTPASNDGALLSKSDSGPQSLTQGYAPDISIANTAGNSVLQKVPVSQNCSEDHGQIVKPAASPILELSSLPTTEWKAHTLTALIQKFEQTQTKTQDFRDDLACKLLHLFWGGSFRTAVLELQNKWHKFLFRDIHEFFERHISPDTVILSQVKRNSLHQLLNHHFLHHGEVYSELPYKSSWLNLNEQLDDIDKEFGFPVTMVNPPQLESDNQTDQAEPVNCIPEPVSSEVPDKVSFPTEPVNSIPKSVVSEVPDKVSFPTEPLSSIPKPAVSEVPVKVSFPTEPVNSIPKPAVSEVPVKVSFPTEPVNRIPLPVVSEMPDKVSFPTELINSIIGPVASEVPDKALLPTELEPVDPVKDKPASIVEAPSTETPSFNEAESCDPWYSFNIQVMPPEEAKQLFEQVQSEIPQSKDTDCQAEKILGSCVETEASEDTDSTLSLLEKAAYDPIEQVCCIARLVELCTGESTPSSKCMCRKQNNKKCTDETLDKDKEEVPKDNSLFENSSYRIFDLDIEEENPEKNAENSNDQITICSSELCKDVIEIIDLTDDKSKHDSTCELEDIFEISNISQSSFLSITDNEYEDRPNSENVIPDQMPKLTIELSEPEEYEDLPNSENEIPNQMPKLAIELSEPKKYEGLPNTENEIPNQMPKLAIELSEPKENEGLPNTENEIPNQMPKLAIELLEPKEYEDLPNTENEIPNQMPKLAIELSEPKEYEDLPNTENEIPNQMPKLAIEPSEPEDKCEQEQLKSKETMQSSASVCDDRQTKTSENGDGKRISDCEEGCAQHQLKSADMAESFLETKGQTQTSATANLQMSTSRYPEHETADRKRKRLNSHDTLSPFQEKSKKLKLSVEHDFNGVSKCQKNLGNVAEAQPLTSNARTAKLVLFGSAQQEKYAMTGARKSHVLLSEGVSCEAQRPPELLSVSLSPLKRKSSVSLHAGEQPVKQRIYEKWRRSLPPPKIRRRNKRKKQKCLSASIPSLILKRKNSEMRVWKFKKPKQSDGHGGSETKHESSKICPLNENSILKFCVLPNTFDFKHGSNKRKESTDPVSEQPDLAKEENQHSNRIILKIKGTWYPSPEKKYKPLHQPPGPKTSSLFHEFQKKYIEKTSSTDE